MDSRGVDRTSAERWRDMDADWAPPPTHRNAIFLFGRRATPWRDSHAAAMADALAEGHATQEPHAPPFLWVGANVVSERLV